MKAYTIAELARQLCISRTHFYRLWKEGKAPKVTKLGRRSVVLDRDLQVWIEQQGATTRG